ncbi:MAG: SurA N-terminal domain-containing protein [Campylobacterota bacterium]|nr:SurA N-terminal domain-containing protein [Campylobacterota bacterium]
MITWMQKHKKWLIVTIWISTIAFVGAGFVGWGSYDYGKSNSTVAIVNDKEVPLTDLQNEYSALYSQYQQMFGETFNKELADQLKLEDAAFQRVVQKYLLINYANDLGLAVTDKEMAKELVKITAFQVDGKFDKKTYMSVLKQNRRTVAEFEDQLKKDLLVSKVQKVFNISLNKTEIKNLGSILYSEDEVSIMVLDKNKLSINIDQKNMKEFWSQNKENYKSPTGLKISLSKIETVENKTKKEMRKIALKKYIKLKKDELKFSSDKTIYNDGGFLSAEDYKKALDSKDGTVLKPLYIQNNYYVIKKISSIEPTVLAYEDVKSKVKVAFSEKLKNDLIKTKIKQAKENFKGVSLGFIKRDSKPYIKGLSDDDIKQFVQQLFQSQSKIGSVDLADKTIVYQITNSKLATYDEANDKTVESIFASIKNNNISNNLLEQLKNKYEIKSFMGKN